MKRFNNLFNVVPFETVLSCSDPESNPGSVFKKIYIHNYLTDCVFGKVSYKGDPSTDFTRTA